jgi:hypothetical protein
MLSESALNVFHAQRWRLLFWILVAVANGIAKALLPRSGDIALLSVPVVLAIGLMIGEYVTRWNWASPIRSDRRTQAGRHDA